MQPILREHGTVNLLGIAINANQADEENDEENSWPDTVLSLLLAKCDPNAVGTPAMTPLCQAIRASDCRAVAQLFQFSADPNLREMSGPQPIFWAMGVASAEYVQQLIDHRADPAAMEVVPRRARAGTS